jgi:hypothetical protein
LKEVISHTNTFYVWTINLSFSKYPNQESISDIEKKFRLKVRELLISQKQTQILLHELFNQKNQNQKWKKLKILICVTQY